MATRPQRPPSSPGSADGERAASSGGERLLRGVIVIVALPIAAIAFVAVLVGLWWLTTVAPPVTSVSSAAVGHSLSAKGQFGFTADCEEIRPGLHTCSAFDAAASGDVVYQVRMKSWRCWEAVRQGGIGTGPQQLDGCAHLNDQLRPLDR